MGTSTARSHLSNIVYHGIQTQKDDIKLPTTNQNEKTGTSINHFLQAACQRRSHSEVKVMRLVEDKWM